MAKQTVTAYSTLSRCGDLTKHLVLFAGQAEAGKSCLVRDTIIRGLLDPSGPLWHKVIILSPTCKLQDTFRFLPDEDLFDRPETYANIIEQVQEAQKTRPEAMRRKVLIVIDDVIGSLRPKEGAALRQTVINLATSGRWYDVCCWILTQQLKDPLTSNTAVRNNLRLLCSAIVSGSSKDELIKLIGGDQKAKAQVEEAFKEPYRFICYDAAGDSIRSSDRVSYCKVDLRATPKLIVRYRQR